MNKILLLLLLSLMFSLSWAAQSEIVKIQVTGMTCPFCVYGTQKKLSQLPGVEKAEVSLSKKQARITMQPGAKTDLAAIRKAIEDAGFTAGEVIDEASSTK